MILAITPNPSIDRAVLIDGFRLGEINRPRQVLALAGGKGLNVARAVHSLSAPVRACVLLAGNNGRWICEQLDQEGIPFAAAWSEGETRISTSIIDPNRPGLTEIYERGEEVSPRAWAEYESLVRQNLAGVGWATFSGSLPPGVAPDRLGFLVSMAKAAGIPTLVDARGEFLRAVFQDPPAIIKINASEAGELLGWKIQDFTQALPAVQALRGWGAGAAIITLGRLGAVGADHDGCWIARSPEIDAIAPVGSGDAFLGGLVAAFNRGTSFPEALRLAVATGAANALTLGAGVFDPAMVAQLAGYVALEIG